MSQTKACGSEGGCALRRSQSLRTVRILILDPNCLESFHVMNHQPAFLYHKVFNVTTENLRIK